MILGVNVKWVTNLADFKKEVVDAQSTVVAHTATVDKLTRSLGGQGLLAAANNYTAAVEKMGGVTKLTAGEKERINSLLTKALEKYQALGREGPAAMVALQQATQRAADTTEKLPEKLSMADRAAGFLKSTFAQFTLASLAASAIQGLVTRLSEFVAKGAQLPALEQAFNRLTAGIKQNSGEMLQSMQAGTKGMVANYDLMQSANKAMLLGLPVTTQSMGELAKTATVLGKAMGQDATKSFDDLITALGRSSPMILDNLGLTVKVGEANEAYAAKLGKTAESLTDAEKKMAFYHAAMEAARKKTQELGDQSKTLGEMVTTAWVSIENVVSKSAATMNVGIGRALSSSREFAVFAKDVITQGFAVAAMNAELREQLERGSKKGPQLTPQQEAQDAAFKQKLALQELEQAAKSAGAALPPLTEKQRQLAEQFLKGNESAAKITERLNAVKDTAGVTERQIQALADSKKRATKEGESYADTLKKLAAAQVPLTASQMAEVDALTKLGAGHDLIAKKLKVSEIAVKEYVESVKRGAKNAEDWAKLEEEIGKKASALYKKQTDDFEKEQRARALASSASIDLQLKALVEFDEKNRQLTMSGSELRLRQIDVEHQKKIEALGKQHGEESAIYRMAKDEIDKFYQHQRDVANGTASTIEERMRAQGVHTRAELKTTADNAVRDYEQMKDSGLYTAEEIQRAWERMNDALRAAGEKTGIDWKKRMTALRDDLKAIGLQAGGDIATLLADGIRTGDWSQFENQFKDILANAMGAGIASAVNFLVPGLGTLLQPLFTALSDKLLGALGLGTKGRDMVKEFAASMGGFDALREKLNGLGAEGERLWKQLTQGVGKNNPEQAKAAIDAITAAFAAAEQAAADAEAAAAKVSAGIVTFMEGAKSRVDAFYQSLKDADDVQEMLNITGGMKADVQAQFNDYGLYAATAFVTTMREKGWAVAIAEAGPMFDQLLEMADKFGLNLEGVAGQVAAFYGAAKNNKDVLGALDALNQMIKGSSDALFINQDLFAAFSRDAVTQYTLLTERGVDANHALAFMQPTLQSLWEAQQKFGFETDAATQKLIDQGIEQGIVGEGMKNVNEKILTVLLAIAETFGAKIPDGIKQTERASTAATKQMKQDFEAAEKDLQQRFDGMKIPDLRARIKFDVDDIPTFPNPGSGAETYHSGTAKVLPFRGPMVVAHNGLLPDEVPAILQTGEAVLNRRAVAALGSRNISALNSGEPRERTGSGSTSEGGNVTIIIEQDGRQEARRLLPYIAGEVKRLRLA